ncbi:MAG: sigma-70 family RNA polymerase sigma factor [Planctomycetota bacterium]
MPVPPARPERLLEHDKFIRNLAKSLLADTHDSDDVAQESAIRVWQNLDSTADFTNRTLRSWIATVVYNFTRQFRRAAERRIRHERATREHLYISSPAEVAEREELRRRIVKAVLALDEPVRKIVILRFYEGLTPREIARHLDIPFETVRTRLRRGIVSLRGSLDREFGGDRSAWAHAIAPLLIERSLPVSIYIKSLLEAFFTLKATTQLAAGALAGLIAFIAIWTMWPGSEITNTLPPFESRSLATVETRPGEPRAENRELLTSATRIDAHSREDSANIQSRTATGIFVNGLVTNHDGKPVGGAALVAYPHSRREALPIKNAALKNKFNKREYCEEAVANNEGNFTISLDGARGPISIVATAKGYSPGLVTRVREGDTPQIQLDRARVLIGTARDLKGNTIANAKITWRGLVGMTRVERQAYSGASGSFRVEEIPSYRTLSKAGEGYLYWRVEAAADGFAPLHIEYNPHRDSHDEPKIDNSSDEIRMDLVLVRGATLRGRVLDATTSEPIPNASIAFWTEGGSSTFGHLQQLLNPYYERALGEIITNDRGEYLFEHIPSKGFHRPVAMEREKDRWLLGQVAAVAPNYAVAVEYVDLPEDGADVNIDIRCFPSGILCGRVIDPLGKPVEGAIVSVFIDKARFHFSEIFKSAPGLRVKTDANGKYQIGPVPASRSGHIKVKIYAKAPYTTLGAQSTGTEVAPRAGESTEAPDITVDASTAAAKFIVKNRLGNPVAGALVLEVYNDPLGPAGSWITDRDGHVTVTFGGPFDPERLQELTIRAAGYAPATTSPFRASVTDPPVVSVILEEGNHLSGKVVFSDGTPIDGASVRVARATFPPEETFSDFTLPVTLEKIAAAKPILSEVKTDIDGNFNIKDLPGGRCHVFVTYWSRERGTMGIFRSQQVIPGIATNTNNITVTLSRAPLMPPTNIIIDGDVRDADTDELIANFKASLVNNEKTNIHGAFAVRTGVGRFRIEEAPMGTWAIRVDAPGYEKSINHNIIISASGANAPLTVKLKRSGAR